MSECNYFYGSQAGSPALGTLGTGDLVRVLDACLVNGYNSVTLTSLANSGSPGMAVANKTAHGFADQQIVRIGGATPAGYNGDFRINRIDADNFSYDPGSSVSGSATGTITAMVAPLGWTIAFTATNQRVYQAPDGNRFPLMINDNANTNTCIVRGFRSMSAITTGTGPFPTVSQSSTNLKWLRPDPTTLTSVDWFVIGDRKRFWAGINAYSDGCRQWYGFGDFKSYKAADAYNTFICGAGNTAGDDTANPMQAPNADGQAASQGATNFYNYGIAICRQTNQSTDSLLAGMVRGLAGNSAWPGSGGFSGATAGDSSPISGGQELGFVDFTEVVSAKYWRRGRAPILCNWSPPDYANNDKAIYKNIAGMPFDKVIIARGSPQDNSLGLTWPIGDWDNVFG